ncbi:MAG: sensor histidine kinase [Segetibacter sp.]|nr:sensor histidine kinase [Segetibacter sp.]
MSFTANIDEYETLYLKDYAHFVFKNKLEDFIAAYFMNIHSFKIPLLQFFSHLSQEQLFASAREGIIKLLVGIESGKAIEDAKETLSKWKKNTLPNIPREAISLTDITLIYSAQKISFQSFLPYYTTDVSVATQVINEIELFYKQVQEMALQTLEVIRKEEHKKRLESEEKYRDLFDNASDLIHIADPEGHIMYVNNAWSDTLGYKPEELKGRVIYDFVKDEEVENFKKAREKIIDEKQASAPIRTSFLKNNGEEITVEGFISCRYENNVPKYTRALLRDITAKLKQEKQIQFYINQLGERERNLRDIIENAPDGVIVIDKESTIILWNPKAEEIFGWKKQEAAGKKITDIIVPPAYREAHENGMKRFVATKQANILNQTIELPAIHKSGDQFYISLTVSHSTQNGKDIFIAFLRDISNQKKNEIELENKRKQLEKSNQELEQYAWLTSHDLKEPLRKILTFSDALIKKDETNLTGRSFNYIQKIHTSAGRMKDLIEAVLSYSNVATDHNLFVETDLNHILKGVLEDIEITISSKNAIIEYDPLPVIEAIPVQMTQLFQNLISNSIKYTNPGKTPVIRITCKEEKEGFKIFIEDNGIGFEKNYAEKIFQVFQRLHNKSYEGTGIGLALCKKIAETHKGSIYAESELGEGSTFVIYLPEKHMRVSSPVT